MEAYSIADCFITLEDFIIKGNKVIDETIALQALNNLNNFFVVAGKSVVNTTSANLTDEEKMIDNHLQVIETFIDEGATAIRRYQAEQSVNIIKYYIKGLSHISKKFKEEWQKAKDKEVINNEETNKDVKQYNTQLLIAEVCDEIKVMLLDKNQKYGNSALSPKRIFSKASFIEQINVRIDDKLSRIENMVRNNIEDKSESINDSIEDLIGYLVLRKVAKKINQEK